MVMIGRRQVTPINLSQKQTAKMSTTKTNWEKLAIDAVSAGHNHFASKQLGKRDKFHEKMHAAHVLGTSVQFYLCPMPTEKDMSWLAHAYPNSLIERGNDQGASYLIIEPIL